MYIIDRGLSFALGILKRCGPSGIKKLLWDGEFASGKWNFIDHTAGDCVYPHVEKYAREGGILDLGCGAGNTATELAASTYQTYVGVDISEVALSKARNRTAATGRSSHTRFERADFMTYTPGQRFEVILLREAMYHVPLRRAKSLLDRYAQYLTADGVFIVRLKTLGSSDGKKKYRPTAILDLITRHYDVLERQQYGDLDSTVTVFRQRR